MPQNHLVPNSTAQQQLLGNNSLSFHAAWNQAPCQCVANDPTWTKTTRTTPKCIFIDLGAADGNTFHDFIMNKYGPVANCPSYGEWEAFLVEANPHFDQPLKLLEQTYPGQVHALTSTAAFTCQGTTSFFIDQDPTHNHWGSSMSASAPDAKAGQVKVTVPTTNVIQLIAQNVMPQDWVMLKVDVEGAEYDLVPCLAQFQEAGLIDRMYLEEHWWFKVDSATTPAQMAYAKAKLQSMNVDIPQYYSPSF
jgi:FkbM family methyltransferase